MKKIIPNILIALFTAIVIILSHYINYLVQGEDINWFIFVIITAAVYLLGGVVCLLLIKLYKRFIKGEKDTDEM